MEYKTTKKEMKENYYTIVGTDYCELQNLLRLKEANSYCVSIYGWACDNYELIGSKQRILLSTGYNPIKTKNIQKNKKELRKIIKKYETKAKKINTKNNYNLDNVKKCLDILVRDFVDEVLESEAK